MSLRLRIALLTAAAVALVEIAIVASIYTVTTDRLYAQAEQELRSAASVIVPVVAATGSLPLRPSQEPERPPNIPRLVSADGRIIAGRPALDLRVSGAAREVAAGDRASSLEVQRSGGEDFYLLSLPARPGLTLQVARSLASVEAIRAQLLVIATAFGGLGIIAALIAGGAVARGALLPLQRLSRAAERITRTGDLTQRVGANGHDELANFAKSFDAMLDRLQSTVAEVERARHAQRQLVADASHELRAPLAAVRANVELLALGSEAPIGDRDELIADTVSGIERLTALVTQLIDLAREEQRTHERERVELDGLVAREVDRTQHRYPGIRFESRLRPTVVSGDPEALTRAVSNLLDNAGKWSPPGGTVHVELRDAVLEVRDEGPGIDETDLPHVFERFYRGSRAASVPGSGLGLAIVRQVMASHGGQVTARSGSGGGAAFTAAFDAAPSDATAS